MFCSPLHSCALAALSSFLIGADEDARAVVERVRESGTQAVFAWGDIDGDGKLELAAVSADGALQLLAGSGDDRFEDVSERVGLAGFTDAALALFVDYDADGRLDLFVGARAGASRLFRNDAGFFVDMTAGAGLAIEGAVRSADWLDHDGDGRGDLHVVTAEGHELYRGLEGGFFERTALPAWGTGSAVAPSGVLLADATPTTTAPPDSSSDEDGSHAGAPLPRLVDGTRSSGDRVPLGPSPSAGGATPIVLLPGGCASSIQDQSSPGTCLGASTTPALGKLYPLSTNLFVAVSGEIGIGTTSPSAKLHVAGTARITDTLTLAPSGDIALDVSTGSIYKGGALFIHTKGGSNNTGTGSNALSSVTGTGYGNTAGGTAALQYTTSGDYNTAFGVQALRYNTIGRHNTASGIIALQDNVDGNYNTGTGTNALTRNTSGSNNTATGAAALLRNTTGNGNTATGRSALFYNTTGYDNTATGRSALVFNTTGYLNTATGTNALRYNTIGYNNTADGVSALQSNTSGSNNTAIGRSALFSNTTGNKNTATGHRALGLNTSASFNVANGVEALRYNTTGSNNTAVGVYALRSNTTGFRNTASGHDALRSNTTGTLNVANGAYALSSSTTGFRNTAIGDAALQSNTSGARNIALGNLAGSNLTTGSDNIDIGHAGVAGESSTIRIGTAGAHTRAFVAGIRGVTTGNANAIPVLIDSAGQLGTISSSRRFKEDIADMGDRTERLLELRPVVFRYKQEQKLPDGSEVPLEYGLIAEEVAEIFPDLVVYDEQGQPFTVKYHLLSTMLLNELRGLEARLDALEARNAGDER